MTLKIRRNSIAPALVLALGMLAPAIGAQDPHAQMHARGAKVMGFDQDKTAHHFLLFDDGGAIEVTVKDPADVVNRDAIRSHLPHSAKLFADGNFEAPMLVHDTKVPGTGEMARLKALIQFTYVELPTGGRVDITTSDRAALDAVHVFLRFQIADHKTGDPARIQTRRKD